MSREVQDRRGPLCGELREDENPAVEVPRVPPGVVGDRHRSLAAPEYGLPVEGRNRASAGGLHAGDDERGVAVVRPAERVARRQVVFADPSGVDVRFEETHRTAPLRFRGIGHAVPQRLRNGRNLRPERCGGRCRAQGSEAKCRGFPAGSHPSESVRASRRRSPTCGR